MDKWDIYRFQIDYIEDVGSKRRPVLCIDEDEENVYCLLCTTHEGRDITRMYNGEYLLIKWAEAGLDKPTYIQCRQIYKVGKDKFAGRRYGRLQAVDIRNVRTMMRYCGHTI